MGKACEDCEDDVNGRRIRCHHCKLLVCSWCWHHVHQCEPSHTRADCRNLEPTEAGAMKEKP